MTRSLFALWLLPASIAAYLQVSYPFNLQLPPVALVGESYEYQIAPTTFATDSDNLQYSLVGNPTWLSLDSNSRTLSGTPSASDVGEINFKINAAGSNGAFVDMDSKLMVAKENGPDVKGNVTQVLATSGLLSGPKTINIGPSKPIDITFPWNTFASNGWSPSYYALLSDHTPLPAWISFDGSSLHFTGTTPSITSTQSFDILLIASQSPGYAGSSLSFTLVISNHQFLFQPYAQTLNLEKRQNVYIDLKSTLLLDGVAVLEPQIQSVDATLPSWLKLDKKTSIISGDAPSGTMSQDISVNATDQFGDVAQLNLHILFKSDLFASEIGHSECNDRREIRKAVPSSVPAGTASNADPHHEDNAGQIAGIIIGSIIGAICGILLLFGLVICLRRRKQRKSYASPKLPRSPKKSDISRPMFIPLGYPHVDVDHDQEDLENGKGEHDYLMHRASEKPPMLDLDLQADDRDDESLTDSIGDADTLDRPMDVKRDSYIRNRASNKSPFFSAAGSRASSSTYKGAPAFMSDAPARRNTIVRPDDDVVEGRGKEMPSSSKARKPSKERIEARRSVSKPSVSPVSETSPKEFPGSLRQNRVTRPYTSAGIHRDRVEKSYARPDTTIAYSSSEMPRRASTRDSLRAYSLKSRLNDLTGSEIFKDADLSDSVYTDEEDEIEEAEKRVMVKPGDFVLPPLQIDTRRRSKRNSAEKKAEKQKRTSKARQSQTATDRKSKRISKTPSQPVSNPKERHSRKSLHSRSASLKKTHSRGQSTAYPFFDSVSRPTSTTRPSSSKLSLMTRDLSGNLTFYGAEDEEPTVEELRSSSIGFRTSNGRINSNARRSRLASLHESSQFATPSPPPKSSKRATVQQVAQTQVRPAGLGLFPVDVRAEMCVGRERERERTPLGALGGENVSRMTPEGESGLDGQKGRQQGWGSLKSMVGKGGRWVSGGYWDKQGREDKVFL
ncbi:hypothetical protein SNOG_05010 [Parastagonospora nodorum SN15]|uniref:Dystroglycan-type cadherin-like domain-containing protein n=1 Tax=Phaeosphaeria nodorum (strain SN15 / ATCC MYA-4574 / FGSC 10173) TaxID=321614 RepID=Q0UTA4_PHANO|nr:hypothetical protein SNOG_05010 [Parastagonospora nodorum SN15]EAT87401.2 hypothetical protein SNOG_05010 [Parastagonospora nodorum SN15]